MSSTLFAPPAADESVEHRRVPTRWPLLLVALWLLSGVFLVQPDQQAVVTRFGSVTEPRVGPGLHYAFPWPVNSVYKLKVRQTRRLVIGGDPPDTVLGRSQPLASQFITGDQNIINATVVVQYSIGDPALFLFHTVDIEAAIRGIVESELARRFARTNVDDILTTEKVAIQNAVRVAAQKSLDGYRTGLVLASVNIDDVTPPAEAADAFRDVASARADSLRTLNESQGYANDLLPRARGEAVQLLESARAYKEARIDRATGEAARFMDIAAEYQKAPQVTAERAYVEAMEQILPQIKKTIVDPDGNLDLTIVRRAQDRDAKK
jgi:membrane protease subunit HflK